MIGTNSKRPPRVKEQRSFADALATASTPARRPVETSWDDPPKSELDGLGSRARPSGAIVPKRNPLPHNGASKRTGTRPVKVLLADDHPVVRRGLSALLAADNGFRVVGEAADGAETLRLVDELKPEIVVLDISMPEYNGLDVTRKLRRESPDVKVVVLTMHFAEEVARECLRAGARAYVLKSDADEDLLEAVRAVRDDRPFFTPRIKDMFYLGPRSCAPGAPRDAQGEIPIERLTQREQEIVKMLCEGLSNKEVASQVGISTRTVESHRNNIMHKLQIGAFSDLVRYAVRHKVVSA
jgi:DNA-binding NarL/FixJ family response regulator